MPPESPKSKTLAWSAISVLHIARPDSNSETHPQELLYKTHLPDAFESDAKIIALSRDTKRTSFCPLLLPDSAHTFDWKVFWEGGQHVRPPSVSERNKMLNRRLRQITHQVSPPSLDRKVHVASAAMSKYCPTFPTAITSPGAEKWEWREGILAAQTSALVIHEFCPGSLTSSSCCYLAAISLTESHIQKAPPVCTVA